MSVAPILMEDAAGGTLQLRARSLAFSITQEPEGSELEGRVVALYMELRPGLYSYLRSMGLSRDEAADIVQETFLRLVTHLAGGHDRGNPRSWVFQVAHNLSVNLYRKEKKRMDSSEAAVAVMVQKSDPSPNPEEQILEKEKSRRLKKAISRLPAQQQRCVLLRAQGLRYREIAEVLGVNVPSVCECIQRAIVRLAGDR